jgi:hypothetical protein
VGVGLEKRDGMLDGGCLKKRGERSWKRVWLKPSGRRLWLNVQRIIIAAKF